MKNFCNKIYRIVSQCLLISIGACLYSFGLKYFLMNNNLIDGGITGISIMTNHFTHIPLGLFIFILNIPFLFMGYKCIGKRFAVSTLFSVLCISIISSLINPLKGITDNPLLATVFGGIILGVGIGLIIRSGGCSDGTEVVAIYMERKTGFSVGQIIMLWNVFILGSAGFIFGWDRAMYSIIAYFIASKTIDITVSGLDETRAVTIISSKYNEISDALLKMSGRGVTLIDGQGAYLNKSTKVIFIAASRLEIVNIKSVVYSIDKNALIIMQSAEVTGKNFEK